MFSNIRPFLDKKDIIAILIIFIIALVLRIFYFSQYSETNIYPVLSYSDSYCYFSWAKDIVSNDIAPNSAFMKWPLYAYFLAFIFAVSGSNLFIVFTLQFLLGAVNVALVYLIAKKIFNRPVACLASLFCLSYGLFPFYEGLLVYTSLSLFLNSCLFLLLLCIKDSPGKFKLFAMGLFLGLCALAQAGIIIFGILASISIIALHKKALGERIKLFFYFLLGLFLIIGSVTLRNYLIEKDFVLISGNEGINFFIGNNPQATGIFSPPADITLNQEDMFRDAKVIANRSSGRLLKTSQVSRFWIDKSMGYILSDPLRYLKLYLKKLILLFSPPEFVHDIEYQFIFYRIGLFRLLFTDLRFIMPLAFIGMVLGFKKIKKNFLLYLAIGAQALVIGIFFVASRYRIQLVPFLAIFAAFGLFKIYETLKLKKYAKSLLMLMAFTLIFIVFKYNPISGLNVSSAPNNPKAYVSYHIAKAVEYERNADYQKAIEELNLARSVDPGNRRAIFRSAVIYSLQGDYTAAEARFREVINSCGHCVDAYYNLGFIYNKQKRPFDALKMLESALSLDPENISAHYELSQAYKSLHDFDKTRNELNFVLRHLSRWRKLDRSAVEEELKNLPK
jgi:tetratricopeptide (TPR) repeat protein